MGGGAWPFLVGGVICLVNSVKFRPYPHYIVFDFDADLEPTANRGPYICIEARAKKCCLIIV